MGDNPYKEIKAKTLGIPDIYEKEIPSTVRSLPQLSENKSFLFIPSLLLITLYLSLSICLTFYQKWVLKTVEYPLTIVMYHLISKFLLAAIVRYISKQFNYRKVPNVHIFTSAKILAPTGLASGIDIGFSNWGLGLVTISLYTMTKSTTIIFILFFAILLGLEKFASTLLVIVAMIAGGLLMFTYKSTSFDIFGFSFLLFASMASGVRWSFAQMIMSSTKLGLHNPIDMMFYMQPWMFLSLMPFMLGFEGPKLWLEISYFNLQDFYYILCKISFGGLLAFVMEISEYLVLSYTSSLTLSITGIFKEICQLILAVEINGDNLSFFNIIGLIFCLGGICCHIIHKYLILVSNENTIQMEFNERNKLTRKTTSSTPKQKVPLLNAENASDSDLDELTSDDKIKNSDIIFDILKRRDR